MKTKKFFLIITCLILSSCASDIVSINGSELSDIDHLLKTPSADSRPQLSFCLVQGSSKVAYGERNRSVESAEYYAKRLPELIKKNQPFQFLEIVGDSETSNCDVILSPYIFIYVTPMQHPEYDVGIGVPRPENHKSLIFWGMQGRKTLSSKRYGMLAVTSIMPSPQEQISTIASWPKNLLKKFRSKTLQKNIANRS